MKDVIEMSFGFEDGKERSVSKIASKLGLKTDEVKRLRLEGIMRIRKLLEKVDE